jgi:hypothetical protein
MCRSDAGLPCQYENGGEQLLGNGSRIVMNLGVVSSGVCEPSIIGYIRPYYVFDDLRARGDTMYKVMDLPLIAQGYIRLQDLSRFVADSATCTQDTEVAIVRLCICDHLAMSREMCMINQNADFRWKCKKACS